MRVLDNDELLEVSGGFNFVAAVTTGSAVGATVNAGFKALAQASVDEVASSFAIGGAIGGLLAGEGYAVYELATMAGAGRVGGALGREIAQITAE